MKWHLFLALFSSLAFSYPEMARLGYINCTSCHISPNGGGVLTQYGRSLSREALSTWGTEKETRWMYFVDSPEWLHLGGDARIVQTHKDTPTYKEGRFILMQADIEAGATYKQLQFVGSLGRSEQSEPQNMGEFLVSHTHYLAYKPTDAITIRGGRFSPAYGIGVADHTASIRRGLGFDQSRETYNIEGSYIAEKFDAFATAILGRPDKPEEKRERGFALRGSYNPKETYKLGLGYYFGHNERADRHLFGPYLIAGFTPKMALLFETDFIRQIPGSGASKWGFTEYARLSYEIYKGIHVYLVQDVYRVDMSVPDTNANMYGAGLQLFPRPHWELIAQYQKQKSSSIDPDNYNDYFWVQLHYYP